MSAVVPHVPDVPEPVIKLVGDTVQSLPLAEASVWLQVLFAVNTLVALKSTVQGSMGPLSYREAYTVYKKLGVTPGLTVNVNTSPLVYLSCFSAVAFT